MPAMWLDVSSVMNSTALTPPQSMMVGAGVEVAGGGPLELTLGLRWSPVQSFVVASGVEVFGAAALAPAYGAWRPTLGLEVGWTSITSLDRSDVTKSGLIEPGSYFLDAGAFSPFYVSVAGKPLRFQLGPTILTTMAFSLGTHWPDPGRVLRLQIIPVQLGWGF